MTNKEVMIIKSMVETIWVSKESNGENDLIWISLLQDEPFIVVKKSVESFIREKLVFPPTIPEILKRCDVVKITPNDIKNSKLKLMIQEGYLPYKPDSWDFQKTLRKIINWEETGIYPKWLLDDINKWAMPKLEHSKRILGDTI